MKADELLAVGGLKSILVRAPLAAGFVKQLKVGLDLKRVYEVAAPAADAASSDRLRWACPGQG